MSNPLIAMFEGSPVMVARDRKVEFESCLAQAAAHARIDDIMAETVTPMAAQDDGFWPAADDWRAQLRPYVVQNGILLIPVRGVLMHNFPWQLGNWATGYDYIWRAFQRGLEDGNVRGIALLSHSPGGLVAGNQVLVDRMYARRDEKPLRAFAAEAACSAAYNIFSVAPHGVVSPTGIVGSIGVMTSHVDWSKFNEKMGLDITFIFAGAHKVDGNPEEPLSDDAKARIQARVDELYDVFVSSVARNRGLDEQAVRGTEAHTFSASQATSNGLADSIGSLDDALSAFADFLDDPSDGDATMTTPAPAVDQAAPDTAAQAAAVASARTEGATSGKTDERARIGAILGCEEAKDRGTLANHIAFNTDMSVEEAKAMLAASPVAAAAPAAPAAPVDSATATFAAAMDGTPNPQVGGGDSGPTGSVAAVDDGSDVIALARSVGITGVRPAAN